jgi:hypothetical protein
MQKLEDHNCCLMFEVEWEVHTDAHDLNSSQLAASCCITATE